MPANSRHIEQHDQRQFYAFIGLYLLCMALAIFTESWMLVGLPLVLYFATLVLLDVRWLYYAFFAVIPFSVEFYAGGMGTDLPSEPLMLLLTGYGLLYFFMHWKRTSSLIVLHPITLILMFHLAWIGISMLFSTNMFVSMKVLLAKLWYVIPFYFLSFLMFKHVQHLRKIFIILLSALSVAVIIVLVRHAQYNFGFEYYNEVVYPIFRNHVTYASMLVLLLPFAWALWRTSHARLERWTWIGVCILFIIGIYFSYTRAAQGSVILAIGAYFIFRFRLVKYVLVAGLGLVLWFTVVMVQNNRYLDFAPDFERTITHHSYDNLLDATIKLEDISTMERVYRWVAGAHMSVERPLIGYGPSTFYENYHKYTVSSFKTYVSDNPEKSGIHNYYLMLLVEQGVIGLLIYLALIFLTLIYGERVYHKLTDQREKNFVMAALLCITIISILQLMNDIIETDKVGPFFFMSLAIIVFFDLKYLRKAQHFKHHQKHEDTA